MADSKYSDLDPVVTPASTDSWGVNQGGVSLEVTREQTHTLESGEHLILPQVDEAATPTLQIGDDNTGLYASSAGAISLTMDGTRRWEFFSTQFNSGAGAGPRITSQTPSATLVNIAPNKSDSNTGLGAFAADNLSLIAGGLEAIRAEDPADLAATETSMWLYDADAGTITQVKVGANGSGSIANHRMLQVADV